MNKIQKYVITILGEVMLGFGWVMAIAGLSREYYLAAGTEAIQNISSQPHLNWFQATFLGLVQGLTEFLPISSTAHLKAIPEILGWGDPGVTFTAVIQLGSIGAVVWYFWSDLSQLTLGAIGAIRKGQFESPEWRLSLGIAIGTVPIVIFGLLLKVLVPDLDNSPIRSMAALATASIVMALLLGLGENLGSRQRNYEKLTTKDGILMGLAQALALMPGVSRSGSTITAGLFLGLERAAAARFSFLLGIPAITLAGLLQLKTDVIDANIGGEQLLSLIIGTVSSAIFSYLSIAWLLRYLQSQNTWIFVWYRLGFGFLILGSIGLGLLKNV